MKFKHLNASQLKYLALALMFLDHIHQMFVYQGAPMWLTMLGRLVFPIFLFLAADSFYYTRNRKKYMMRLLVASVLMALGNALLQALLPNPNIVLMNNAFSTFFVTGLLICGYDLLKEGILHKKVTSVLKGLGLGILPFVLAVPMLWVGMASMSWSPEMVKWMYTFVLMIPNIFLAEGGMLMVLMGLSFYLFRENRWLQIAALAVVSGIVLLQAGVENVQWMMIGAALPMAMYNGQKGHSSKWLFYIFYPAHIYILYLLSTLLFA